MGLINWLKEKLFHKKKEEAEITPKEREASKEKSASENPPSVLPKDEKTIEDSSKEKPLASDNEKSDAIPFTKHFGVLEPSGPKTEKVEPKEVPVETHEETHKEEADVPVPKNVARNDDEGSTANDRLEEARAYGETSKTESEDVRPSVPSTEQLTVEVLSKQEEDEKKATEHRTPSEENPNVKTNFDNVGETKEGKSIEDLPPAEEVVKNKTEATGKEESSEKLKEEETKEEETKAEEPVKAEKDETVSYADSETKVYNLGLAKSRESFGVRLNNIANKYKEANSDYFDELERCLIEADVGVKLTMSVLDETEKMAAVQHIQDPKVINDLLVDNLFMNYAKAGSSFQTEIQFDPSHPTVLLVVGVNGTGKTTTIAKLAKHYKKEGKKVMVIAADTFRAGAVEQLSLWAKRVGVFCFERGQGADPASVCYDGIKKAIDEKYDLVLVDTAGRLHTKEYLMDELGKINRVIQKVLPVAPQETWLVLDANTGQNGVQQAKVFKEVTSLTGVVITKMDGTSKGGIILAIRDQLGVPVRFIGLGEHEEDLREFDLDRYLYALLVGEDVQSEE